MTKSKGSRVTISQVAKKAGVSIGTVSHYLNGTVSVSEDRSKRIQEAINALHYIPDKAAGSLRRKDIRLVYILTPDLNNTFYTNIIRSFMDMAVKNDYNVQLLSYEYSSELECNELAALENSKPGTVVIVFNGFSDEHALERLISKGIHVILADRDAFIEGASSLFFENLQIFKDMLALIKEKNYQKIGFFTEPLQLENIRRRYHNFLYAASVAGYDDSHVSIYTEDALLLDKLKSSYDYMNRILDATPKEQLPDVWCASSDHLAIGLCRSIIEHGYTIPGDFGVIGFDNIDIARYITPSLTTADQDRDAFGHKLFEALKKVTRTSECVRVSIPQKLIVRESC